MSPAVPPRAQAVGQQALNPGAISAFHAQQQGYQAGVNFAGAVAGTQTFSSAQLGGLR